LEALHPRARLDAQLDGLAVRPLDRSDQAAFDLTLEVLGNIAGVLDGRHTDRLDVPTRGHGQADHPIEHAHALHPTPHALHAPHRLD
jgi:hypothetical protein